MNNYEQKVDIRSRKVTTVKLMISLLTYLLIIGYFGFTTVVVADEVVSNVDELSTAIRNANSGGDNVILIEDGSYRLTALLQLNRNGITIRSQSGNREAVILDGEYHAPEIFQVRASNITISDLTLKRASDHPVHIFPQSGGDISNIVLSNLHIIDPGQQAVKINQYGGYAANNGTINNSYIELTNAGRDFVWSHNGSCYTGGIDAHRAAHWKIQDNTIVGFWCSGGLSEHGVHIWDDSRGTLVERNKIIDCDRGIGFGLNSSTHHGGIIRNNMIYNPTGHGFTDVGIGLESADNAAVYNNTIFQLHNYANAIEYRFGSTQGGIIKNNLSNKKITARSGGSADLSHNIIGARANWFADANSGNLHLVSALSNIVDLGIAIAGLSDDFDGNIRPLGSGIDIGADEYSSESIVIRADVDQNFVINTTDAMLTLRSSLGLDMSNTNWHSSNTTGDVNCDEKTNSTDAMLILSYSLSLSIVKTDWCE